MNTKSSPSVFCCPAHGVCASLGLTSSSCCYASSQIAPSGMASTSPRQSWCPPALRGVAMMLAYSLRDGNDAASGSGEILADVRRWADALRVSTSPCRDT